MKLRELLHTMQEVQKKIGSAKPYICGGTPRDKYMGHLENISDLDITTGDKTVDYLSQEFAIELKKKYNITRKTMEDGHSTIFVGTLKMDFSSNFNVPGIEQILAARGIPNATDMQKEMFSRDFTCNSLLLSMDLKNIVDPTHRGFKDIKERKIRTCLDPKTTLTSNRNRVIRAIYLAAKLDFDLDDAIVQFVQQNPESVKISTEKAMAEKLNEAFKRDADKASYLITKLGLWNHIPITEAVYPYYIKAVKGKTNVSK
jgi:poly(A) polymerase